MRAIPNTVYMQIGLGGWAPRQCMALENEIAAWQKAGGFNDAEAALRSIAAGAFKTT